jgi:hypothetical protein
MSGTRPNIPKRRFVNSLEDESVLKSVFDANRLYEYRFWREREGVKPANGRTK